MIPPIRRILLVEDEPDQIELTLNAFRQKGGPFEFESVSDGKEAVARVNGDRLDAVLLDYSLPTLNGLEALRLIREKSPSLPVVMVTGHGHEAIAVEAMKLGANDYVVKSRNYHETLPLILENVLRKCELERRIEEGALQNRMLFEIAAAVVKERKVDALVRTLTRGVRQLIRTQAAAVILVDPNHQIQSIVTDRMEIAGDLVSGPLEAAGILVANLAADSAVVIDEPHSEVLWSRTPPVNPIPHHLITAPIRKRGELMGVIVAVNKEYREPFTVGDINALSTLAIHAAEALDNARFLEELEYQAITDSLTGLYNHREFQKRLSEEMERGLRYGTSFSLLMIDIDNFKTYNDSYGHPSGDLILKGVVEMIRSCVRAVDIPARYGGEEFAVILPETHGKATNIVAERIRRRVEEREFILETHGSVRVTVSVGVSEFPHDTNRREDLILAADEALYFAKTRGRNRVATYGDTIHSNLDPEHQRLIELMLDPEVKAIRDLASAIDSKSPYTRGHTEFVLRYGVDLAEALSLSNADTESLRMASLLHNIGTVSVPESVLNKPGPLSPEELKMIQAHPGVAALLVRKAANLESILPAVIYHHERWDGGGYPSGLKGDQIPYVARILGVIEAYHAMVSVRPYRPKLTKENAIAVLKAESGKQFDPDIVAVFTQILERES